MKYVQFGGNGGLWLAIAGGNLNAISFDIGLGAM